MTSDSPDYTPISCAFHDRLEALATVRKPARIRFRDRDGVLHDRDATIRDVTTRDGAEYLAISTGEIVRLDHLVEVDGARLADD